MGFLANFEANFLIATGRATLPGRCSVLGVFHNTLEIVVNPQGGRLPRRLRALEERFPRKGAAVAPDGEEGRHIAARARHQPQHRVLLQHGQVALRLVLDRQKVAVRWRAGCICWGPGRSQGNRAGSPARSGGRTCRPVAVGRTGAESADGQEGVAGVGHARPRAHGAVDQRHRALQRQRPALHGLLGAEGQRVIRLLDLPLAQLHHLIGRQVA